MTRASAIGLVVPFAKDELPYECPIMYPDVRFVPRGVGVRALTPEGYAAAFDAIIPAADELAAKGVDAIMDVNNSAVALGILEQGVAWNDPTNPALGLAVLAGVVFAAIVVRQLLANLFAGQLPHGHVGLAHLLDFAEDAEKVAAENLAAILRGISALHQRRSDLRQVGR